MFGAIHPEVRGINLWANFSIAETGRNLLRTPSRQSCATEPRVEQKNSRTTTKPEITFSVSSVPASIWESTLENKASETQGLNSAFKNTSSSRIYSLYFYKQENLSFLEENQLDLQG